MGRRSRCSFRSLSSAISRMTVSIVPSTGRLTARYAVSLAPRNARLRSDELTPSCRPSTSTKPRTICEKMTPELPRAPMSAARVTSFATASLVVGRRRVERLDDRAQREDEVRAGVAVGDRIDVQIVDAPAMRLEVLERAPRQVADDLELHQRRPYAFDVDLERRDREPDHPLELVQDARTNGLGDLGQLQPMLDDDAKLDDEPARRAGRRRPPS